MRPRFLLDTNICIYIIKREFIRIPGLKVENWVN